MGWWKADPVAESKETSASTQTFIPSPLAPHPISPTDSASSCPVDPKTRSIWLQAAQKTQNTSPTNDTSRVQSSAQFQPVVPTQVAPSKECSSDRIDQTPPAPRKAPTPETHVYKPGTLRPLSQDREISSIPRGYPLDQQLSTSSAPTTIPSNAESETGHDKGSGNWIYPSESQFFNAVMRKQTSASSPQDLASSVSSIIPIHNAVNERAWHLIRAWEGSSSDRCGGPKLLRFEGKGAGAKSPRAVMKSWSGYTEPFDRHDWTVQRCDGTEVEYVIDFYQGRAPTGPGGQQAGFAGAGAGGLNFYLDVRPKLNSFEGCRMRFQHAFGLQ